MGHVSQMLCRGGTWKHLALHSSHRDPVSGSMLKPWQAQQWGSLLTCFNSVLSWLLLCNPFPPWNILGSFLGPKNLSWPFLGLPVGQGWDRRLLHFRQLQPSLEGLPGAGFHGWLQALFLLLKVAVASGCCSSVGCLTVTCLPFPLWCQQSPAFNSFCGKHLLGFLFSWLDPDHRDLFIL